MKQKVNHSQRFIGRAEKLPQFWHWKVRCSAPLRAELKAGVGLVVGGWKGAGERGRTVRSAREEEEHVCGGVVVSAVGAVVWMARGDGMVRGCCGS